MDQDSIVIESPDAELTAKDNSNAIPLDWKSEMEMDIESEIQADHIEPQIKITQERPPSRSMMHSGDGIKLFDTLIEQIPCSSKSLRDRSKRRNSCPEARILIKNPCPEVDASQRLVLPRASKIKAYESLKNISKRVAVSKKTLSRSMKRKRKRKAKQPASVQVRPNRNTQREKPPGPGTPKRTDGRSCVHGCRCGRHDKRPIKKKESLVSIPSASSSRTGTSESTQSEESCR